MFDSSSSLERSDYKRRTTIIINIAISLKKSDFQFVYYPFMYDI